MGGRFPESGSHDHFDHSNTPDGHTIGTWTASQANPDVNITSPEADVENHDGNVSNNGEKMTTHAACNSKPHGEAKPSQLGFYSDPWLNVLIGARNNYRKMVHTSAYEGFLEHNAQNLTVAHNILLKSISEYIEHSSQLDECLYQSFSFLKLANNVIAIYDAKSSGMTAYVCDV